MTRSTDQRIRKPSTAKLEHTIQFMKTTQLALIGLLAGSLNLPAQFNSGSDGSYGPLHITAETTLDLPPDGIFHCTTIHIARGGILRFNRNALNTPVYLLATGDVTIEGTIDVSGRRPEPGLQGGAGGPGGFDGGHPGVDLLPPGDGHGPGAGRGGTTDPSQLQSWAGSGAYGIEIRSPFSSANHGASYGSPLQVPLIGGSGGGGAPLIGGGGGGGAILIASNTRIGLNNNWPSGGGVVANGGGGGSFQFTANGGSGGAIRLVAPVVAGSGTLQALGTGGNFQTGVAGAGGRIRIDCVDRRNLILDRGVGNFNHVPQASFGSYMVVFPNPVPRLEIINAAGTNIPEGSGPVTIQLPNGSDPNRTVTVQARGFTGTVPTRVVLTPDNGPATSYDAEIVMNANPSSVTVPVTFPVSTPVRVSAWTR